MRIINKYFKLLIILLIFSSINISFAQTWDEIKTQTSENTLQIQKINDQIPEIKDNYKLLYDGAQNQNNQLSNQIGNSNNFIGLISLVLTIFGVLLGIYIENRYKNIKEIQRIIKDTKDFIEGHNSTLYERIKDEESTFLLKRLIEIPEDIDNIVELLLSRNLKSNHFTLLCEAYEKARQIPEFTSIKDSYLLNFNQHFPYESLNSNMSQDVKDFLSPSSLNSMFWNDLEKYTKAVIKFSVENKDNSLLIKLFSCTYLSPKFKNHKGLTLLFSEMKNNKIIFSDFELDMNIGNSEELKKSYKEWLKTYEN